MTTGDRVHNVGSSGIVCVAGAATSGNVRGSFAEALRAARALGPATPVRIKGNVVAEAEAYDFTDARIEGLGGGTPTITFPNGSSAFWQASADYVDFELRNVGLVWQGTSAAFAEVPLNGLYVLLDLYASISTDPGATKPFLHAVAGAGSLVDVMRGGRINAAVGRPFMSLDAGGAFSQLTFGPLSVLSSDALTGGDAGAFSVVDQSAGLTASAALASISHTQTGANAVAFDPP